MAHLVHVCHTWRRVLFATPAHLGVSLICDSRTPLKELLARSPPLPLIVYWGSSGTFDTDDSLENILCALKHPDRVRRITLRMCVRSLHKIFSSVKGPFPILETLQLFCSFDSGPCINPSRFEAPKLRHLQLSNLTILSPSTQSQLLFKNASYAASRRSIVTFSLGEITTTPAALSAGLASMPCLKVLKIGVAFSIRTARTNRMERHLLTGDKPEPASLNFGELEEFEYKGTSDYLEAIAARITAPFLKKLSVEIFNAVYLPNFTTFKHLSQRISKIVDLSFQFARVRFKEGFSIAMDHNELSTGRGAFELIFKHRVYYPDLNIGLVANICRVLAPKPSTVQSLLLDGGVRTNWDPSQDREGWRELLRVFKNIKTLRVTGRFVELLNEALKPDREARRFGRVCPCCKRSCFRRF